VKRTTCFSSKTVRWLPGAGGPHPEDWAAMAFPETGQYVVPDALDLVAIDREQDRGTYAETNLWMRHI
jgi:hypothetical protein